MSLVHVAAVPHSPYTQTTPDDPNQQSPFLPIGIITSNLTMSDITAPNATEPPPAPFTFQPPAGGDTSLKSCDGTTFRVHSVLLGLASTVFADMFTETTKAKAVELEEDAESISLMLAFTYPVASPSVTSVDLLEKAMKVAQKYKVERIIKFIEENVHIRSDLVLSNPLRVFHAAVSHNFPTIQALSAKILRPNHCDLLTVDGLLQLAQLFPAASPVIGLVGAQGARIKILDKVLLNQPQVHDLYPQFDPAHRTNKGAYTYYMICNTCWSGANRSYGVHYVPGWFGPWTRQLYNVLLQKPVHQCDEYFSTISLVGGGGCSSCVTQTLAQRFQFDKWAQGVKEVVEKELAALDALYSL